MPIDDLTALGQKMREARKNKELTQQELSDLSHVSVKQIANIEKGKMNPSYLILRALAKVLHISLDTLINPDISLEDEGVNQMKMLYSSCPPEMRDTLLHHNRQGDRNAGSFIGYTGSISVPVVFRYDNSFYSKMIQQELAAKHSYNDHSMAESFTRLSFAYMDLNCYQYFLIFSKNASTPSSTASCSNSSFGIS